jgi:glycosyltransferase involved in cell wall biosynthesis
MTPAITVIIPTKDRLGMLRRAVATALAQEDVAVAVVVVDDGSRDGTGAWLGQLDDERVSALRNETPGGSSAARNRGLATVSTEWVAFLDDDDLWAPDNLAAQIAAAEDRRAVFACASAVVLSADLEPLRILWATDPDELPDRLWATNVVGGPSRMVARTDAARAVGGFDERLAVMADWEFYIRLAQRGPAAVVVEPLVAVVQHADNMQVTRVDAILEEIDYVDRKHAELRAIAEIEYGSPQLWRWVANQYRRAGRRGEAAKMYWRIARRYHLRRDAARAVGVFLGERVMSLVGRGTRPDYVPDWISRPAVPTPTALRERSTPS